MSNETTDGIVSPTSDELYSLVADLGAMAESVQLALERRANAYRGTQTERLAATSEVQVGSLWKDTTGENALYVRQGTGWVQVWPTPVSRRLTVGTYDTEIGPPFQVFRELRDGSTYVAGIELLHGPGDAPGFRLTSQKDGQYLSRWTIGGEGYISYTDVKNNAPSRTVPFATTGGVITVESGSYTANTDFNRALSFPSGFFSSTPVVKLTPLTAFPKQTHVSLGTVSETSATVNMLRESTTASFQVHWEATQFFPNYAEDWPPA